MVRTIKGHDIKELELVGYWDSCFFTNINESSGLLYRTKSGEIIKVTHNEIKKNNKGK